MKKLLNLEGIEPLSKTEQKAINGGVLFPCLGSGEIVDMKFCLVSWNYGFIIHNGKCWACD